MLVLQPASQTSQPANQPARHPASQPPRPSWKSSICYNVCCLKTQPADRVTSSPYVSLAGANGILQWHPPLSSGLLRKNNHWQIPRRRCAGLPPHVEGSPTSVQNALTSNSPMLVEWTPRPAQNKGRRCPRQCRTRDAARDGRSSCLFSSSAPDGMRHNIRDKIIVSG